MQLVSGNSLSDRASGQVGLHAAACKAVPPGPVALGCQCHARDGVQGRERTAPHVAGAAVGGRRALRALAPPLAVVAQEALQRAQPLLQGLRHEGQHTYVNFATLHQE